MRCFYCRETSGETIAQSVNKICPSFCNKEKLTRWVYLKVGSWVGNAVKEQINQVSLFKKKLRFFGFEINSMKLDCKFEVEMQI